MSENEGCGCQEHERCHGERERDRRDGECAGVDHIGIWGLEKTIIVTSSFKRTRPRSYPRETGTSRAQGRSNSRNYTLRLGISALRNQTLRYGRFVLQSGEFSRPSATAAEILLVATVRCRTPHTAEKRGRKGTTQSNVPSQYVRVERQNVPHAATRRAGCSTGHRLPTRTTMSSAVTSVARGE